ncbi:hypothetical protein LCZ91_08150 [Xanthomonas citri pv. mangiferaeindicae]|nr:hypothetical protein [Xanthomonas citri]UDB89858.1 hypothetical protein LCZ91_08150 [Xanthomonas citri pv. mangiferaeindicae]
MNTGLAQGPFRDDGRHCQQVLASSQFLVEGFLQPLDTSGEKHRPLVWKNVERRCLAGITAGGCGFALVQVAHKKTAARRPLFSMLTWPAIQPGQPIGSPGDQ